MLHPLRMRTGGGATGHECKVKEAEYRIIGTVYESKSLLYLYNIYMHVLYSVHAHTACMHVYYTYACVHAGAHAHAHTSTCFIQITACKLMLKWHGRYCHWSVNKMTQRQFVH